MRYQHGKRCLDMRAGGRGDILPKGDRSSSSSLPLFVLRHCSSSMPTFLPTTQSSPYFPHSSCDDFPHDRRQRRTSERTSCSHNELSSPSCPYQRTSFPNSAASLTGNSYVSQISIAHTHPPKHPRVTQAITSPDGREMTRQCC